MKYRILYLIALFALFSCSEQLENEYSMDSGLETTISVVIPQLPDAHPQSRAMSLKPDLKNLKLAVFDNNGYLLEYVSATEVELATENEIRYGYKVQLRPTDFPTYIHFIGNAPENIQFGTETEAIGSLFTEGGNEAYWQRIELPNGIKKNGDTFDSTVTDALTDVRLVRNFAWIQLELGDEVDNFSMDSYCVVNTYPKGSIAPYNTSKGEFADFAHQQTHADLLSEGYNGFIPAGAELNKTIPDENNWFKTEGQSDDSYAYFIYEREKALSNPPFILLKGTYTPESGTQMTSYYKVDLRDQAGYYFPLIRNFRYKVRITKVMHEGHATAALAAAGSGSGDVSTAIETEDYTNISNGVARIFVSYTDTTLVAQPNVLKLRYKFMVFETKDANGNVIAAEQILNGDDVTITKGEETQGKVIETFAKSPADTGDGWREITIQTTKPDAMSKSQDIIINGAVTIGGKRHELQRKVTITLTQKYSMQLVCNPTEIIKEQGTPFDVVIKVPGGLRPAMFPLDIQLEAYNQSMTPDQGDDLPVITGKSIISEKATKTTIGFIKQIQYDDYLVLPVEGAYRLVTCHFKSNKAESATSIYADNKYFNQASTSLRNYTPSTFSGLTFSSSSLTPGGDVTFSFTMSAIPTQGDVYVVLKGLEPADGENRLVWDSGKGCYRYAITSSSNKSGSFNLTCVGTESPASVQLSAYHFENAEKEINVQLNTFSNLEFDQTYLTSGSTQNVTFTFNMSQAPSNDVFVTLTNLEPKDNSVLTLVDASTGKYKFITRPTGTSASIVLRNTVTEAGSVGTVELSSLYFNDATASINVQELRYIIPQGNITTGRNNTTYYIFASDPGETSNNNGNIGRFTTNNQGKNNAQIEIDPDDVGKLTDGFVYIRYSVTSGSYFWQTTTYYVAKVLLSDLMKDGGCNISRNFVEK